MWSRLCPTPFGTWTCWSRGPSNWLLWRLTMLRRMRRQRSGPFYILGDGKGKSNHHQLLLFIRMRLTVVWNVRMTPKQLRWRMGSAPPRPLRVTLRLPRHLKPLRPFSRQSQQVPSILQTNTQQSTILIFVSLILLSFLTADSAKPAAKSEDLVLGVLIGLYDLNLFYFQTVGFAVKLSSPCWRT